MVHIERTKGLGCSTAQPTADMCGWLVLLSSSSLGQIKARVAGAVNVPTLSPGYHCSRVKN